MSQNIIVELAGIPTPKYLRVSKESFMKENPDFPFSVKKELTDDDYQEALFAFITEYEDIFIYNKKDNSIVIQNRTNPLLDQFHAVQRLVKNLTWENYSNSQWRWELKETVYPQYGVYINYVYLRTLLQFLEGCKNEDKFYIGGILDYC